MKLTEKKQKRSKKYTTLEIKNRSKERLLINLDLKKNQLDVIGNHEINDGDVTHDLSFSGEHKSEIGKVSLTRLTCCSIKSSVDLFDDWLKSEYLAEDESTIDASKLVKATLSFMDASSKESEWIFPDKIRLFDDDHNLIDSILVMSYLSSYQQQSSIIDVTEEIDYSKVRTIQLDIRSNTRLYIAFFE